MALLPSVHSVDSTSVDQTSSGHRPGRELAGCVGEGRGCRTSPVETPALLDRPSIRGVGVGGQLPVHSPTQTSGRAGDVDGSTVVTVFQQYDFILFFSSIPWNTHVVFLYLQSE